MSQRLLERSLPHNVEAERAILGAVLTNNDQFYDVAQVLKADDFYLDSHRHIMRAIAALMEQSVTVDLITIQASLIQQALLESAGGIGYIASLLDGVPYLSNIGEYCKMVQEKALMRAMISASSVMMAECFDGAESATVVLDRAEQTMLALAQRRARNGLVPLQDMRAATTAMIERLYEQREMVTGLATGYIDLDRMTSGFQPGDLVIIAARPSAGKTAIAMNMACHCVFRLHKPVAVFSLEMSKEALYMRVLCSESLVDAHKMRTGYINHEEMQKLQESIAVTSQAPMFIDDTSMQTVMDIRTAARTLHRQRPLGMILVDYMQLMSGGGKIENRQQEISTISRGLKTLARELGIPVVALSQLSRAPEQRQGDHRPMLSDLRESGSIEQDADTVMFVFREEMYNPNEENMGLAELIIAKQRNGPTGIVKLAFLKQFMKFENLLQGY